MKQNPPSKVDKVQYKESLCCHRVQYILQASCFEIVDIHGPIWARGQGDAIWLLEYWLRKITWIFDLYRRPYSRDYDAMVDIVSQAFVSKKISNNDHRAALANTHWSRLDCDSPVVKILNLKQKVF